MTRSKIRTSGAEGLTLSSTDVTVASGDLLFGTSGKGVNLGVTSNTDSNTIDDYEEGTHQTSVTMKTSGTTTLNTSFDTFSYTKVGRIVTITGNPRIASVSSPVGQIQLSLPFTALSGQTDECRSGGFIMYYDDSAGSGSYLKPLSFTVQENTSLVVIGNTHTNGNNLNPASNDELNFCFSYITA